MKIIIRALPFAFLLNLISFSHSSAQFGEPKLLLAGRLAEAWYDVDMDGDPDMVDIVNGIWTEQGPDVTFFKQHIISTDALELLHDMDQDGDIDALGRGLDNTVRWYENNNDGEFWTANDMGNWDGYHHFFDVNMDGQEDLLNAGGSQTFVHFYIGPGQFGDAEPFPYPNPELFFYELMDDLDGDGFKDIISNFCALEGCIVGTYNRFQFSTQNYIEYNDQFYATMFPASSGDIDNDGDNEPLMLGYNGNAYVLNDAGSGDITTATAIPELDGIGQPIRIADLNGDGFNDILSTESSTQVELVSFGTGNGSFLAPATLFSSAYQTDMNAFFNVVDIDGDADMDISNVSWIFINDGNGLFGDPLAMIAPYGLATISNNFNSDETSELVILPGGIIQFDNNGVFADETPLSFNNVSSDGLWMTQTEDFNQDGFEDVAFINYATIQIVQCDNNGVIELAPIDISSDFNGNFWDVIEVDNSFDMNGDGNKDVVFRSLDTPYNLAIITIGTDFTVDVITAFPLSGPIASMPSTADYDMDGDMDLIFFEDNMMYLNNDGFGNFTSTPFLNNGLTPGQGNVDINGDGIGDSFGGNLIIESDGYGNNVYHYLTGLNADEFYISSLLDLNADGLPEIILFSPNPVSASNPEFNIYIYRNNGNFQFAELYHGVVANGMTLVAPGAMDVDADGLVDLVWGMYYQDAYRGYVWMKNSGFDSYAITGHVFVDENDDGEWSADETGVDQTMVTLAPDGNIQFVNDVYYFPVMPGSFDVTVNYDADIWYPTTSTSYSAAISDVAPIADDLNFGLRPINPSGAVDATINGSNAVCEGMQHYVIQLHNYSDTYNSILVTATFDPLLTYLYTNNVSEYSIIGNEVQWLLPGQPYGVSVYLDVYVQYPGVETIGNTLITSLTACLVDESFQPISCDNETWTEIQSCAYDPNDKQVSPAGLTSEGYIENGTELTFTVRFQNTGNAPAQDVFIEDQLSEYLDLSTIEIIAWSHDMTAEIDENRNMRFLFPSIMLPDSLTDPVGSQGFVTYRVMPLLNLAPGTVIENTGEIYFDLNPAIITNTTLNTIYECGEIIQGGEIMLECGTTEVFLDPEISNATGYSWNVNGIVVSTEPTLTIPANGQSNFDVLLEVQTLLCNSVVAYTITIPSTIANTTIDFDGFYTLSTSDQPGYTYSWFLNDVLLEGETGSSINITTEGDYTVNVTNPEGCTGSYTAYFSPISVDEHVPSSFLIYPSPALDFVRITSKEIISSVNLYSITGTLISSFQVNTSTANIPLEKIASGQYVLEIIAQTGKKERHPMTKL